MRCRWRDALRELLRRRRSELERIVPGTIRSILRGERPVIRSDGEFVLDYFYVEDGAAAYMLLAENLHCRPDLHGQAFNFSNEIEVTVLGLVQRILRAMERLATGGAERGFERDSQTVPIGEEGADGAALVAAVHAGNRGLEWTIAWYGSFSDEPHKGAERSARAILDLVGEYYDEAFAAREFVPGVTPVPVAGRVFDAEELRSLVDSVAWTSG